MNETQGAAAPLDPKDQRIKDLEHEVDMLTNAGVIECAVRNKSVSEYMEHWEGRATKAEQALALRGEPVAEDQEYLAAIIGAFGPGEGVQLDQDTWAKVHASIAKLLAAPISGEREEKKIICHAEGPRCHGCAHYQGTADICVYAPAVSGERVNTSNKTED